MGSESGRGLVPTLELTSDPSPNEERLEANDISPFVFTGELWKMLLELAADVCRRLLLLSFTFLSRAQPKFTFDR